MLVLRLERRSYIHTKLVVEHAISEYEIDGAYALLRDICVMCRVIVTRETNITQRTAQLMSRIYPTVEIPCDQDRDTTVRQLRNTISQIVKNIANIAIRWIVAGYNSQHTRTHTYHML